MKTHKIIPQFELPGTQDSFALRGEIIIQRQAKAKPATDDSQPFLFVAPVLSPCQDIWMNQLQAQLGRLAIDVKHGAGCSTGREIVSTANMLELSRETVAARMAACGMLSHNVDYVLRGYGES